MNRNAVIATLAASLSLTACIQQEEPHPVARALPTAEDVKIDLPDRAGRTIGEVAPWYVVTRDVTRTLNGGTAWVLIIVHTIVQFPPTTQRGETYVWGPWSDSLDPAEYKLEVTEYEDGYHWTLSGRNKTVAGSQFEMVIFGVANPGGGEGRGHGEFLIDFDAGARVNPIDSNGERGAVEIMYDLERRHLDLMANSIEDRGGVPTPVAYFYAYDESADRSGNMRFQVHADSDDAATAAEDVVLRSRWLPTGAGRADLSASGGDLGDVVGTASQCWNDLFRTVFTTFSLDPSVTEGRESDCAFATAEIPSP